MLSNPCIEIQASEEPRPAVPAWFAEVVIVVQSLTTKGVLDAFARAGFTWSVGVLVATSPSIFWDCCWVMRSAENAP